jgi:undecaprenyl-diphosphatase
VVAFHSGSALSISHAVLLSALQGFTELFPFSSLGIQVIVPRLLHWNFNQSSPQFLPFVVSLHVGTAFGLLVYFWRDWVQLVRAWWQSLRDELRSVRRVPDQKTIWLLIVATIPAGLVGLAFRHPLARLFAAPLAASLMLIVNGGIMAFGERWVRHREEDIPGMGFGQAVAIGVAQVLALIPGLSRSGVTMVGGLSVGLSYETAARFSFLMATPIILAAGVLEVHHLHGGVHGLLHQAVIGFVVAAVVAYLSVRYLMRYFETHRLLPLALISAGAGIVFSALLLAGL